MTDRTIRDEGRRSGLRDQLGFRNRHLVLSIVGFVYDSDADVPWLEVIGAHTSATVSGATVERRMHDLVAHGALHRVGHPASKGRLDTRALRPTFLGRAWLDREVAAWPWPEDEDGGP